MKNQCGAIKTNLELYRVVMGGSGGYRRLPGGSDDFLWHTDTHCIIIYISSSYTTIIISPAISKARESPWRGAEEGGWGGRGGRGGIARRRLRRSRFPVSSSYCLKSSANSVDKYSAHSVDKSSAHSVEKYSAHSDCWLAGKREVKARLQSGRVGGVGVLQQDLRYRCDGNVTLGQIMDMAIVIILCLWVWPETLLWLRTFRRNDSLASSNQSFETWRSILSPSDRFHFCRTWNILSNISVIFFKYFKYFVKYFNLRIPVVWKRRQLQGGILWLVINKYLQQLQQILVPPVGKYFCEEILQWLKAI